MAKTTKAKEEMNVEANMTTVLMKAVGLPDPKTIKTPELATSSVQRWKELESAMKEFKPDFTEALFDLAEAKGVVDEKGNATLTLKNGYGYKKEVRQSVSVDQEAAVQLFKDKGKLLYVQKKHVLKEGADLSLLAASLPDTIRARFFDDVEVVNDSELESAFFNGVITDKEFSSLVVKKVTNALKFIEPKAKKK